MNTSGLPPKTGAPLRALLALVLCLLLFQAEAWGAADKKNSGIRLFGTVEFGGSIKKLPSWLSVLERNAKNPIFIPGKRFNSSTVWDQFRNKLKAMPPMEQLRTVNRFWNQWPYRLDQEVYGKPDYWAAPYEFLKKSGDCEDYSIAKYFTLREIGFQPEQLRIAVVKETIRGIAHAVLIVYLDDDAFVLDNLNNSVLSHKRIRHYLPQFSVNELSRWVHVKPK